MEENVKKIIKFFRNILIIVIIGMDWLDLLAVQGTLNSLLQYHSSKASILWHSAFFIVKLSHPYSDYWKNHCLD